MRHRLEYLAVAGTSALVRVMPRRVGRMAGSMLGLAFYALDNPHRRLAVANLQAAFPARSRRECRAIARRVFGHFGRLLMDVMTFSTLSPKRMLDLVEIEGGERLAEAHALGRGVLLLTGHFGFWELAGLAHAAAFQPISVVARPLDNPYLHHLLEQIRTRTGNSVIYRRGGIRRILRALSRNRAVAMLIDQHIHGADSVYVDFFDRPASTTTALAALALRTGAPIIPVFTLPLPGGRYRQIYDHPVDPPSADDPNAIRIFTQRCTDVLEMYVRRYPHLWLWMHRRWRERGPVPAPERGMFPAGREDAVEPGTENG